MLKLKLTVTALAIALAGTATAGWRSMRVEAADIASFQESVITFEEELSSARHYVFMLALNDIWAQGMQSAAAEQREYTQAEYLRQLDGLTYDDIVTLADSTGKITKERYRTGVEKMLSSKTRPFSNPVPSASTAAAPVGGPGGQYRGGRGY